MNDIIDAEVETTEDTTKHGATSVGIILVSTLQPLTMVGHIAGCSTDKQDDDDDDKAKKRAVRCFIEGHRSVFEHINLTFDIRGISRACSHQLVRHRHVAFTQQSQRYVKQSENAVYYLPDVEWNETTRQLYEQAILQSHNVYLKLVELGFSPEDARYVLPNSATTNIIATMNMSSFAHFWLVRSDPHAQTEIRRLANGMLDVVSQLSEEWKLYSDLVKTQKRS